MLDFLQNSLLFAQDGAAPATNQQPGGMYQFVFMLVVLGVMFYVMMVLPNRRRERDRKKMLAALKKNDHVVTVGGIKGVVANVKPEEDEVVLKIDETTGAKIRVVLSSIASVKAAEEDASATKKES